MSYTTSFSETYSLANAKILASNIITDLELCSQRYGEPGESRIEVYKEELIILLKDQYVDSYEFGFENSNEERVVSWKYKVRMNSIIESSDSPGSMYRKADITGCNYFNFLTYSDKWSDLTDRERAKIKNSLPLQRGTGNSPADGNGYWKETKSYNSGGCLVTRRTFIPV